MAESRSIFTGQKTPRNVTKYMLSRGVADYSALEQWDNFETGYAFLFVLEIPDFLDKLAEDNASEYGELIKMYRHILEYDFKNLDGLEDITTQTNDLQDGINTLPVITQVVEQSGTSFSMRYYERSGSIITKVNELYLRGIKDPRTQVKRYNGILKPAELDANGQRKVGTGNDYEPGYDKETFSFLYFVTDNTCLNIEKAYLLVSCQPTNAETSMYNYEKGNIQWRELNYTFNGYPITGPGVTAKAQSFLKWVNDNTIFEESKFGYKALNGTYTDPTNTTGTKIPNQPKSEPNAWWSAIEKEGSSSFGGGGGTF